MKSCSGKNSCNESTSQKSLNPNVDSSKQSKKIREAATKPRIMGVQEGWKFQWTTPRNDNNLVIPVIRGPFLRPKLVMALPYVVENVDRGSSSSSIKKLRDGIPDPWVEYLTWQYLESKYKKVCWKDVRMSRDYQRFTDYIWKKKGLAMVQGIPDPWKFENLCLCEDIKSKCKKKNTQNNLVEANVNTKKKNKIKDIERNISKLDKVNTIEMGIQFESQKKLNYQDGFDKVKKRLLEIENELKLKDTEQKCKVREVDKFVRSRLKELTNTNKKVNTVKFCNTGEKICYTNLFKSCSHLVPNERKKKKRGKLKNTESQTNETLVKEKITLPNEHDFENKGNDTFSPFNQTSDQKFIREKIGYNDNVINSPLSSRRSNSLSEENNSCPGDDQLFTKIGSGTKILDDHKPTFHDFVTEPVKSIKDDFSDDENFYNTNNVLSAAIEKSASTSGDRNKIERDNTSNLFIKRSHGKKEEKNSVIFEKSSSSGFENKKEEIDIFHVSNHNDITSNTTPNCPNNCNKKNCEKHCFNKTENKNELIIESISETDD